MLTEKNLYIDKNRSLPKVKDYHFLRSEGLKYIEVLASDLWTDYNTHDPGITILEVLCYAITELGYRTDFDIKDLLADKNGDIHPHQAFFSAREILPSAPLTISDYRKLLVDIEGIRNAWLVPVNAPNTKENEIKQEVPIYADTKKDRMSYQSKNNKAINLKGLNKVILDLEESDELGDLNISNLTYQFSKKELKEFKFLLVFSDWKAIDYESITEINCDKAIFKLSTDVAFEKNQWVISFDVTCTELENESNTKVSFIAQVMAKKDISKIAPLITDQLNELDQHQLASIFTLYQKKVKTMVGIFKEAKKQLNAHRNLCEDFLPLSNVCTRNIAFCADIEVNKEADIEEVYARILLELQNYLSPEIKFYTLPEMVNKGVPTEEIFEGPALKHGFIITDEIEETQLRKQLLVSDMINFIMDIEGVLAVSNVMLTQYGAEDKPILPSEQWCLTIENSCKPVLDIARSKVLFFKDQLPFRPNEGETLDTLSYLRGVKSKRKLKSTINDFEMLKGTYKDLDDFVSIEHEFPAAYQLGNNELPDLVSPERKAQVRQLKAYLKFYDQVLANFFSQLAHAKNLFSIDPNLQQTYFGQYVGEVKDIENIYEDAQMLKKVFELINPSDLDEIKKSKKNLLEKNSKFYERRNRFLDHLIARFSETFNDYVLMRYSYTDQDNFQETDASQLLKDKVAFLKDYPVISRERGQAFDYFKPSWNTDNVSGYEKRLARLSGIRDITRKHLFCLKNVEVLKSKTLVSKYYFQIVDEEGVVLLKSMEEFDSINQALKISQKLQDHLPHSTAYNKIDNENTYSFRIQDEDKKDLAESGRTFDTKKLRNEALEKLIACFEADCPDEGMHIVEHLLLRPRFNLPNKNDVLSIEGYQLFPVCLEKDCDGNSDPYSFRISIVLPYWHERFRNQEFRRYFERMARTEAPAHCMVKICWISNTSMRVFEKAYKEWLKALADYEADLVLKEEKQEALREASNQMIEIITALHSEFPEARLHDCVTSTTNAVLLNQTILGTDIKLNSDEKI